MSKTLIFISYAHANKKAFDRFEIHLKSVIRDKDIEAWSDKRIKLGQKWHEEIQNALERAAAAVLLISPEFLSSDYITNSELPVLLKAARDRGLKIFSLILSPCAVESAVFKYPNPVTGPHSMKLSELQAANSPDETLSEMKPSSRDRAFMSVALAIVAEDLPPPPASIASPQNKTNDPQDEITKPNPSAIPIPIPIPIPVVSDHITQHDGKKTARHNLSREERFQQIQTSAFLHVSSFQNLTGQSPASLVDNGKHRLLPNNISPTIEAKRFADHVVLYEFRNQWGKDGWVPRSFAENMPLFTAYFTHSLSQFTSWLYCIKSGEYDSKPSRCPMFAVVYDEQALRARNVSSEDLPRIVLRLFFFQLGHFVLHRHDLFPESDRMRGQLLAISSNAEQEREAWIYASAIVGLALGDHAYSNRLSFRGDDTFLFA